MKHSRGFILVYVIVMLSVVGVFMALLATGTQSLILQTNRAQLSAIERNLQLSAVAWARHQRRTVEPTSLDVTHLTSRPAELNVSPGLTKDRRRGVRITTQCTFGRQSRQRTISLQITVP